MKRNKLYTTVIDKSDPEGVKITVKPSKYLKKLPPDDVIAELQAYVQSLFPSKYFYKGVYCVTEKRLSDKKS